MADSASIFYTAMYCGTRGTFARITLSRPYCQQMCASLHNSPSPSPPLPHPVMLKVQMVLYAVTVCDEVNILIFQYILTYTACFVLFKLGRAFQLILNKNTIFSRIF